MAYQLNLVGLSDIEAVEQIRQIPAGETSLALSGQDLGLQPERLLMVIKALEGSGIQSLDLSSNYLNRLSAESVDAFFTALNKTNIHTLNVRNNGLGIAYNGVCILPYMLKHIQSSSVRSLDLGQNYLSEAESYAQAQIIEGIGNCRLDSLGLAMNDLGNMDTGTLVSIGDAVCKAQVRRLDVSSNMFYMPEDAPLVTLLSRLGTSRVESIDLSNNELEGLGEDLKDVFSTIKSTPIRVLGFKGNCDSGELEELVAPFKELVGSCLSAINVEDAVLEHPPLRALAQETVAANRSLQDVCHRALLSDMSFFQKAEEAALLQHSKTDALTPPQV